MISLAHKDEFRTLINDIKVIVKKARYNAVYSVNAEMLKAYYGIGRRIVEEEQKGDKRAAYGERLIDTISSALMKEFGKGFNATGLRRMRRFYLTYPKWATVSPKLAWSHYVELIKIEDETKRKYFERYATAENLRSGT